MVAPFTPDAEKLAAVRAALPALAAGIYLNTGSVGPLPAETAAAMAEAEARERDVGRAHPADVDDFLQRMAEARAGVAAVLGTDVGSVALSHSTTDGMNAATLLPDWRRGGRAVTSAHEHAGAIGPLVALRDRMGIELTVVDAGDDGDDERTLAAFDAALTPDTRLVSVSHVLYTTGAVLPVAGIAELAHARGALVVVDGAQAAGAIPARLDELGADLYAVAAQKWLLGPEGMGSLVVRPSIVEALVPALGGWFSFEQIGGRGDAAWWSDARRFEASGYHRPSVVGMARSIGWLSMYVGWDFVHRRGAVTAAAAAARLAGIPGVSVLTPPHAMATLVTFRIAGWSAQAALDELESRVFAIARTIEPLDAIRISVGFFTSDEEIERFAEAVALLAAHTPDTLPPRRTLTILGER
ncbi:MAG TPA: aminotransferase class V-fold PLP-dependent enzyme [Candidatus Limnocylindrales bacterium]|nr:aminotransferase class V-fold PLP-dependent enzyme [Candidatus Limnocylindrales bacterium]